MVSEVPKKSIFHRIADSITGFVPSSILQGVSVSTKSHITTSQVTPGKSGDLHTDVKPNLKRTNDVLDHLSELGPKNNVWGSKDHFMGYPNVDLDATDKSESECSLHSFSTSGVSSLMPKSWLLGYRKDQSKSLSNRTGFCSESHTNIRNVSSPVKTDYRKQSTSCQNSLSDLMYCHHPAPKRQRLSTASNRSPYSCQPRFGTTYGGAASCHSARELFGFTTPLKFDLQSDRNPELRNSPNANLSSTARRILETLENLSTPLTSGYLQSTVLRHVKQVKSRVKSHRFAPFSKNYEKVDSLRKDSKLYSFCENQVQNTVQPQISSKSEVCIERSQSQKCITVDYLINTVEPISEMCKTKGNMLLPVYTFADPIHKYSQRGRKPILFPTAHKEYFFSCPSRSCLKCSAKSVGLKSSIQQFSDENICPAKPKIIDMNTWRCETCLLENSDKRVLCEGCSLPKSNSLHVKEICCASSTLAPVHTAVAVSSLSTVNKELSKWECPTCMVYNEHKATHCICCQTARPTSIATSVSNYPSCMIQNNEKLSEYSSCTTVKPVEKPVFMNNPSPHKIATQPIDNFKFGYSAQNLENSEKLKAFSSIIVDNSDHDQKVHSTKDIQFSFDTFGKLPIQGKQSESSVRGESLLQTNHEPQFKLSSQSEVINSYSDFKGFKPSTVTSVDSSYEQSQLLDSINFKFSCTASNTAVSDNPLFSNVFERNNALFSPSNPSNSTGLNTITSISLNFPNQQETGAFNFNSAFQMTKDVMLSTTSPQFSNHDAPVNNEIRKKVQAVRRLRR